MKSRNLFFGKPIDIWAGEVSIGTVGKDRYQLAANNLGNKVRLKYGKKVRDFKLTVNDKNGKGVITAKVKNSLAKNTVEITEYMVSLLEEEAVSQKLLTKLLRVVDKHSLDNLAQWEGKADLIDIGSQIHDKMGIEGMQYLANSVGYLRHTPGLVRIIDSQWSGIGEWLG